MKKETVNTFEGGLNKDLNPIITPNNILTDNLNGTFITFNGDELSLQNDSGNTKIKNSKGVDIKLSDGFEPLGIKEYGGILYITSIKRSDGFDKNGVDPLPDIIEFGSYPAPADNIYEDFPNVGDFKFDTNNLYQSELAHPEEFRAGRDIRFNVRLDFTELSYLWTPNNLEGLYKIKLLLSLNSGVIDLTDDIWNKFLEWKVKNPSGLKHWIMDNNFRYYCPFNYKGKLLLRIELNEPIFKIKEYGLSSFNNKKYEMNLTLDMINSSSVSISGWKLKALTNYWSVENIESSNSNIVNLTITEPPGQQLTKFKYTLIPKLKYNISEINWEDLPNELQEKLTITKTIIVNEELMNVNLKPIEFGTVNNQTIVKALMLTGEGGHPIDFNQNIVSGTNRLIFTLDDFSSDKYTKIGTFTVDGEFAKITEDNWLDLSQTDGYFREYVEMKASQVKILGDFIPNDNYIMLNFDTNLTIKNGELSNTTIIQNNSDDVSYEIINNRELKIRVYDHLNYLLTIRHENFDELNIFYKNDTNHQLKYNILSIFRMFKRTGKYDIYDDDDPRSMWAVQTFASPPMPLNMLPLAEHLKSYFDRGFYKMSLPKNVETSDFLEGKLHILTFPTHINLGIEYRMRKGYEWIDGETQLSVVLNGPRITDWEAYGLTQDVIEREELMRFGNNDLGFITMPRILMLKDGYNI